MDLNSVLVGLHATLDAALAEDVYDGPTVTSGTEKVFVLVGSTGEDDDAATTDLSLSNLGNRWDDESGEIVCSAWATSGSTDIPALRVTAAALVEACRDAVNASPRLGVLPTGYIARVAGRVALRQSQTSKGAAVRFTFTVTYSSLLTS